MASLLAGRRWSDFPTMAVFPSPVHEQQAADDARHEEHAAWRRHLPTEAGLFWMLYFLALGLVAGWLL